MLSSPVTESNSESFNLRKANVIRISIMLALALFGGSLVMYLYTAFGIKSWQFYLLAVMTAIVAIGDLVALSLSQRNKINIEVESTLQVAVREIGSAVGVQNTRVMLNVSKIKNATVKSLV